MADYTGFLEGYRGAEDRNRNISLDNLKMASGLATLKQHMQERNDREALRTIMTSPEPPEAKLQKLLSGAAGTPGVQAAHSMLQAQHQQGALKVQQGQIADVERAQHFRTNVLPQFMQPGQPARPEITNENELGQFPATAAVPPKFDAQGLMQSAVMHGQLSAIDYAKEQIAERKPVAAGAHGLFDPVARSMIPGSVPQEKVNPMVEHRFPVGNDRVQPHISLDKGVTWNPIPGSQPMSAFARQVAPVVNVQPQRDTPHPVVGVDANGNQVVNFVRPSEGATTLETKPVGSANIQARIDNSRASQIQNKYTTSAKPIMESLNSAAMYHEFRNQGDFAQASTMAAETLRRAARGGSAKFKGEAAQLLGSGYGSGNLWDRFENFLSQDFTPGGGATKDTMAKLDKLIGAAEDANFENLARTTKFFAAQVKGQPGLKLTNAIGAPFVSGMRVAFPDGTYAKFKSNADAENAAKTWLESNQ